MGLVGLAHPVLWHSSRHGHAAEGLTDYQNLLKGTRFRNWYTADWDYALTTVYFFCIAIFLFTLFNILSLSRSSELKKRPTSHSLSLSDRVAGLFRYFSSRQFHISLLGWYSPPLGSVVIVGAMIAFFGALSLAVHPYYWPVPAMGNSPPLATRTGWISIAIMPFMFAFSSKFNPIGILTGTPYEKLQVFHRWTAWIMYITSLIHTFPFIVFNVQIGKMENYYRTKSYYWTGVAALIPQTWLVLMSWGPIRSRYYETFKKLHFLASIIFMGFLFLHCNFRLTSWDYFWATAGVYGFAWFARFGFTLLRNGIHHTATFTLLPDPRMVHVRIPTTTLKWQPGQHYFVRFLDMGVHAFTSHPFTVASLPESGALELCVRVREGMTARLAAFAGNGKGSRVLLDGPYGSVHGSLWVYDRVLLLAGGSGASFTVPLLLDLIGGIGENAKPKHVHFVWAVTGTDSTRGYEDIFRRTLKGAPEGSVTFSLYITGSSRASSPASSTKGEDEKEIVTREMFTGRPKLAQIVNDAFVAGGTVGIASCGPDSFSLDVRNAVAECQLQIARGHATCTDIFLHTETYSW
ncbi:Ferric/cupric reductase transmembrane component 7 [Hypsizygus marmoreus]|uniref:ferric-chelate reductase (NADPH) n=1 Tax=Hypsizygus marmoreus TaxID=39966 RepID=A0A369JBF6_HYPMA|nr:Ferric/cupric reductase transmembrane component 7 [Hypsizygus marmoreus]